MGRELKIGLFATAVIIVVAWFAVTISNYRIKKRNYKVLVDFDYVGGLDDGAPVRLSGVLIGEVAKVDIYESHPRVTLEIEKDVKINKEALIYINTLGIIGEAYIEITVGDPSAGYYENKSTGLVLKGRDAVSMGDLIYNLNDFSLKLGKFEKTIDLINSSLSDLSTGIDDIFAGFNAMVKPFQDSSDDIYKTIQDTRLLVRRLNNAMEGVDLKDTMKSLSKAGKNLDLAIDDTRTALKKINDGQGTLGKLMTDDSLHKDLKKLSRELETTLEKGNKLQFWWYGDLVSDRALSQFDGNLNIEFYPGKSRFYTFGLSKLGSSDAKFNASLNVIVKKIIFSAGIMEETPALGIGYNFTDKSRLRLDTIRWDQGFNGLNLRISFRQYIRWAGLNLTLDDLIHSPSVKFGLSVRFREEDFKYLLGIVF